MCMVAARKIKAWRKIAGLTDLDTLDLDTKHYWTLKKKYYAVSPCALYPRFCKTDMRSGNLQSIYLDFRLVVCKEFFKCVSRFSRNSSLLEVFFTIEFVTCVFLTHAHFVFNTKYVNKHFKRLKIRLDLSMLQTSIVWGLLVR